MPYVDGEWLTDREVERALCSRSTCQDYRDEHHNGTGWCRLCTCRRFLLGQEAVEREEERTGRRA